MRFFFFSPIENESENFHIYKMYGIINTQHVQEIQAFSFTYTFFFKF